jgi:hypothetical protein
MTREYRTEGERAVAKVTTAMQPEWVGRSVSSEGGRSQELREMIVESQRTALALLQSAGRPMDDLSIRWVMEDEQGAGWFWNPQIALPDDITILTCEARCVYV